MPEKLYTTITFDLVPDAKGGVRPVFTADPTMEKIAYGTAPTLVWQLVPGPGAPSAQFTQEHGVYFAESQLYPNTWPNKEPAPVPEQTRLLEYWTEDPNKEPHKEDIIYKYTVRVTVDGKVYAWDPEDDNEGGGPGGGPGGAA